MQRNQKNALIIFENALGRFQNHLQSRTFFVGQQMTIADVAIASSLAFVAKKVMKSARTNIFVFIIALMHNSYWDNGMIHCSPRTVAASLRGIRTSSDGTRLAATR